jgi:putative transposase
VKRKRLSVEQIAGVVKQTELGAPIAELCRPHGICKQSDFRWKKICGGMEPSEARELKRLVSNTKTLSTLRGAREQPGLHSTIRR